MWNEFNGNNYPYFQLSNDNVSEVFMHTPSFFLIFMHKKEQTHNSVSVFYFLLLLK